MRNVVVRVPERQISEYSTFIVGNSLTLVPSAGCYLALDDVSRILDVPSKSTVDDVSRILDVPSKSTVDDVSRILDVPSKSTVSVEEAFSIL